MPEDFRRQDESPDPLFYLQPRFVTHIDAPAVAAVAQLYREVLPPGGAILDLMSSWISHLPSEIAYRRVVGIGLNRQELAANPRLNDFVVQDLNHNPQLAFANGEFDAAAMCVSIQYLIQPATVLREVGRVLCEGGATGGDFLQPLLSDQGRGYLAKARRRWPRRAHQALPPRRRQLAVD